MVDGPFVVLADFGDTLLSSGDPTTALKVFRKLHALTTEKAGTDQLIDALIPTARMGLAEAHAMLGHREEAIAFFKVDDHFQLAA